MKGPRFSFGSFKPWLVGLSAGAFIVLLAFGIWFLSGLRGIDGPSREFSIPKGERRIEIAQRLQKEGIIRSWPHFVLISYLERRVLLAGQFTLDPTDRLTTIVRTLSLEEKRHQVVTIPEGWRREQIAEELAKKGVDKAGFLSLTEGLEGRLFPDTYYISVTPKAQEVVSKFTTNYFDRTKELQPTKEQLILASIVEREAKRDDERALIAGIYAHRLAIGMKLEADPTVQYGRDTNLVKAGTPPQEFWQSITVADYQGVVSSYNTYRTLGLPPGAISNPGIKSIEAAVHPTSTTALYFFHTADGKIITSKTYDEHLANKRQYLR
ncbi:MAG TPA: endolytic transglycosylase MltG [Patescibacteria group bacterium]